VRTRDAENVASAISKRLRWFRSPLNLALEFRAVDRLAAVLTELSGHVRGDGVISSAMSAMKDSHLSSGAVGGQLSDRIPRHAPHHRAFLVPARDELHVRGGGLFPDMLSVWVAMIQRILKREAALYDVMRRHSLEGVAKAKALRLGDTEHGGDRSPIGGHRPILGRVVSCAALLLNGSSGRLL